MMDPLDRRVNSRIRAQLETARTAGAWMPWAGAAIAVMLWGAIAIWMIATLGIEGLMNQPPAILAGGVGVLLATGLTLICAGVMAREGARSSQANAIVLTSARLLLEPAESSREEVSSLAEAIARETQAINRALGETRNRLDGLKGDIEVSVTAALKAAEIVRADSEVLVHKMGSERQGLAQLAENLRHQSDTLAKAIPRHAQLMADATRAAQEQVRQADATLDQRLRDMNETAGHLAQRISQLDTMGAESRKRAQNLASVLMRLDEQLVQSTRMVEAATKAGELAAAATKSTAESLRDTVSDAIGSALKATETINSKSAQASDDARQAMTLLKEAGLQAEATTRAATHAARAHADETERRINQLSDTLFKTATKATNAAESGLERARARIEKASLLIGRMKEDSETSSVDDLILEPLAPAPAPAPAPVPEPLLQLPPAPAPSPLFAKPTAAADAAWFNQEPRPAPAPPKPEPAADRELVLDRPVSARPAPVYDPFGAGESKPITSWRGLLGGVDEVSGQVEETSAGAIIDRLDRGGVRLHVVKASDLRRIANAAHQGERQRRRAIRDTAPSEIQRVSRMLEADRDLQHAARSFVAAEEPDALRVLSMAERAREDAAPRLSAYLLLDAALGTQI
jgi:predicted chitinase